MFYFFIIIWYFFQLMAHQAVKARNFGEFEKAVIGPSLANITEQDYKGNTAVHYIVLTESTFEKYQFLEILKKRSNLEHYQKLLKAACNVKNAKGRFINFFFAELFICKKFFGFINKRRTSFNTVHKMSGYNFIQEEQQLTRKWLIKVEVGHSYKNMWNVLLTFLTKH